MAQVEDRAPPHILVRHCAESPVLQQWSSEFSPSILSIYDSPAYDKPEGAYGFP